MKKSGVLLFSLHSRQLVFDRACIAKTHIGFHSGKFALYITSRIAIFCGQVIRSIGRLFSQFHGAEDSSSC